MNAGGVVSLHLLHLSMLIVDLPVLGANCQPVLSSFQTPVDAFV